LSYGGLRVRVKDCPLRADEIRNDIVVAALVVLVALLALRFDLVSWLLADQPAGTTVERASQSKRAAEGTTQSAARSEPHRVDDRAAPAAFDVVRMASDGPAVFAGRAPAEWNVTILANAEPVATVKADRNGEWAVVIDQRFPPGDYRLSLTAKPSGVGRELIGQSVRVTIASSARPPLLHAGIASSPAKVPLQGGTEPIPPTPITFAYDSTDFTPAGRREAAALSDFLRQQKLATATLSGHADERGSDAYNMELSRRRLDSVARYLRDAGYAGKLVLVPKGRSEPFLSPERGKLLREDALQLDRRVELHLAP
jgi:outer membrane protein OmpA-like peptidoglycan-associated protein